MAVTLSTAEYDFVGSVPTPDGWPLEMLTHGLDERAAAGIRATALSLLKRDLIGLHGGPENVNMARHASTRDLPSKHPKPHETGFLAFATQESWETWEPAPTEAAARDRFAEFVTRWRADPDLMAMPTTAWLVVNGEVADEAVLQCEDESSA